MGRLYDAYVEVGPRFAGFGDIKNQGDKAGKEYGKALTDAAEKAAKANVRRLGEALAKARSAEADAIGKVRGAEAGLTAVRSAASTAAGKVSAAEARLAELRRKGASAKQTSAAEAALQRARDNQAAVAARVVSSEESLASAQRKSTSATNTAKVATEALEKAQKQVSDAAGDAGRRSGGRFSGAFKGALSKIGGEKEGRQVATRFGVGMNGAIGGIVSRSAGIFVAGFAAVKSAQVFSGFINDARESAKVARVSAQVIQSTGGAAKITAAQMGDLATAISTKTGADDEDIQSGENLLATFTNVRNEVGKNNDIFNRASQAAVDMASAMNNGVVDANGLKAANIQLGKALNDPIKGVSALSKVGVSFTAKQKEQIKTLVDSGKTLEAQKIILAEVGKEFGGAAAAAADPATRLKTILGNLSESAGGLLLPTFDKVVNIISDTLVPGIYALGAAFQGEGVTSDGFVGVMERIGVAARTAFDFFKTDVLPRLKEFGGFIVGTVIPAVGRLVSNLVSTFTPAVKGVFGFFKAEVLPRLKDFAGFIGDSVLPKVAALASSLSKNKDFLVPFAATILTVVGAMKAWALVQGILNVVLAANPIGLVVVAIAGLVGGIVYAYKHSEKFRDIVNGAFNAVKDTIVGFANAAKAVIGAVVTAFDAVKSAVATAIGFIGDHWKLIVGIIGGPVVAAVLLVTTYWGQIKSAFSTAVSAVLGALKATWGAIVGVISGPLNVAISVIKAVWSRVMPILVLPFYIANAVIAEVFAGIQVVFSTVAGWVKGAFAKAWNAVTGVLSGPINLAKNAISTAWAGISTAFTAAKNWVTGTFSKAWAAVKGVVSVPLGAAKSALDTTWTNIKTAFTSAKNYATGAFSKAWAGLKAIITTPISLARTAISGILGNAKGGLQYIFSTGVTAISGIWNRLKELAKAPIRFIVNTVLNQGLIGGFNWIANKFNAPTIPTIPLPKGFAAGGRIPGLPSDVDNTFGFHKGGAIPLATGEFIVNARQTAKHLPLLEAINNGEGFADGGLFGSLKKAVSGAFTSGKNLVGDVADFTKDAAGWFKNRFKGPLSRLDELGNSPVAKIVTTVPRKIADTIVSKAKDLLKGMFGGGPDTPVGKVVNFRGELLNQRTIGMLLSAEAALRRTFHIMQGSYSTRVAASGSTHAGGGAMDTDNAGAGWDAAVRALRAVGFAAWHRTPSQGPWSDHIHSIAIGDPTASPAAKAQVQDYLRGGDGLGGMALGGRIGIYDKGGRWPSGTFGYNGSGKTETVLPGGVTPGVAMTVNVPAVVGMTKQDLRDYLVAELDALRRRGRF